MKKNFLNPKKNDPEFLAEALEKAIAQAKERFSWADCIILGAGAGLSASGGLLYHGERFMKYFADFHEAYGITDIYSGGFYPFSTPEEQWGWWCRHIYYNRYAPPPCPVYTELFHLLQDKDYFILTTNVDHQFQKAGFDKKRMFYTQGDYGLYQCSTPCSQDTFQNQDSVEAMIQAQEGRFVPTALLPLCPHCNAPMTPNLRKDSSFVEDEGWHRASEQYQQYLQQSRGKKTLFLELGVGYNTPGIIKVPFLQQCYQREESFFLSINQDYWKIPSELKGKSLLLQGDISQIVSKL